MFIFDNMLSPIFSGTFACTEYTAAELELKMAKKCLTCGDNLDVKCSIDIISSWNSITVGPTIPHDTLVLIVEIAGTRLGKAEYFKQFQNMTVSLHPPYNLF